MKRVIACFFCLLVLSCGLTSKGDEQTAMSQREQQAKATFAGGCFWCMQPAFDQLDGVVKTTVGYAGGNVESPSYEQVVKGNTGHAEAIQIIYDPKQVSYERLLDIYWHNIDPTQVDGQFADRGSQYRTAIFYHDAGQQQIAKQSKEKLAASGRFKKPIVTEIVPATKFYSAEAYHQKYYQKNPTHYQLYKVGSGREGYLKAKWADEKKKKP